MSHTNNLSRTIVWLYWVLVLAILSVYLDSLRLMYCMAFLWSEARWFASSGVLGSTMVLWLLKLEKPQLKSCIFQKFEESRKKKSTKRYNYKHNFDGYFKVSARNFICNARYVILPKAFNLLLQTHNLHLHPCKVNFGCNIKNPIER